MLKKYLLFALLLLSRQSSTQSVNACGPLVSGWDNHSPPSSKLPNINNRPNAEDCCEVCMERRSDGCVAFTWNDYNNGTCWLKAGLEPLVEDQGVWSGTISKDYFTTPVKNNISPLEGQSIVQFSHQLKLSCPVHSIPPATFSWSHNAKRLNWHLDSSSIPVTNRGSTFHIDQATPSDAGTYHVIANNTIGSAECLWHVVVSNVPTRVPSWLLFALIALALGGISAALVATANLLVARHRFRQRIATMEQSMKTAGDVAQLDMSRPLAEQAELLGFKSGYEIERARIVLDDQKPLGAGQFGVVLSGRVMPEGRAVACKVPRNPRSFDQLRMLFAELKVLMHAETSSNRAICKLIGACTDQMQQGILIVALELAEHGSLTAFLGRRRPCYVNCVDNTSGTLVIEDDKNTLLNTFDLIAMSYQLANGMSYLAKRSIVHRDLAARNVLVAAGKRIKIADFGLARQCDANDDANYSRLIGVEAQPLRWMPPECLGEVQNFSESSDVWSYGVTLWEMFELGVEIPYASFERIADVMSGVVDGSLRLARPRRAPIAFYKALMLSCWASDCKERPNFQSLAEEIRGHWLSAERLRWLEEDSTEENNNNNEYGKLSVVMPAVANESYEMAPNKA